MAGNENTVHTPLRMPVPWVFAIAYVAGLAVQFLIPSYAVSAGLQLGLYSIGILILAVGVMLAVWGQWLFRKARTTTVPGEISSSLVTSGPYRFSRNPMYLGLFLFFAGLSVASDSVWSVMLLVAVLAYVNLYVVPIEEKQLTASFGDAYERYRERVRRWI